MSNSFKKLAEIFVGFEEKPTDVAGSENTTSSVKVEEVSFPKSNSSVNSSPSEFPTSDKSSSQTFVTSEQCEPHMTKIFEKYEQGFESLNAPGYDFFEFYKSVMQVDPNNKQVYDMALSMAKGIDSSVSKEKLIEQSNFYISELNKVHKSFTSEGTAKENKIVGDKQLELTSLNNEISSLEKTIEDAKVKLEEKRLMVSNIDIKYEAPLVEIKCKLQANDMAKDKLVRSIELVVNNLK